MSKHLTTRLDNISSRIVIPTLTARPRRQPLGGLAMKIAAQFDVAIEHLFSFKPFEPVAAVLRRAGDSA